MTQELFNNLDLNQKIRKKGNKAKHTVYSLSFRPGEKLVFAFSKSSGHICVDNFNYKDFIVCLK